MSLSGLKSKTLTIYLFCEGIRNDLVGRGVKKGARFVCVQIFFRSSTMNIGNMRILILDMIKDLDTLTMSVKMLHQAYSIIDSKHFWFKLILSY